MHKLTRLIVMALLVALPALYALSLGPLVGIINRMDNTPEWFDVACDLYASPAEFAYERSPEIVQEAFGVYIELFE